MYSVTSAAVIAVASFVVGYVISWIVNIFEMKKLNSIIERANFVIYELESRVMKRNGLKLTDKFGRAELRASVTLKVARVIDGELDCDSEEE